MKNRYRQQSDLVTQMYSQQIGTLSRLTLDEYESNAEGKEYMRMLRVCSYLNEIRERNTRTLLLRRHKLCCLAAKLSRNNAKQIVEELKLQQELHRRLLVLSENRQNN